MSTATTHATPSSTPPPAESAAATGYIMPTDTSVADQYDREQMPQGYQPLVVAECKMTEPRRYDLWVDTRKMFFSAPQLEITFRHESIPGATTKFWVTLPPMDKAQLAVYKTGTKEQGTKNTGMHARRFLSTVVALGFDAEPGRPVPLEAADFRNWVGRKCRAMIVLGPPKSDGNQFAEIDYSVRHYDAPAPAPPKSARGGAAGNGTGAGAGAPAGNDGWPEPEVTAADIDNAV